MLLKWLTLCDDCKKASGSSLQAVSKTPLPFGPPYRTDHDMAVGSQSKWSLKETEEKAVMLFMI